MIKQMIRKWRARGYELEILELDAKLKILHKRKATHSRAVDTIDNRINALNALRGTIEEQYGKELSGE